MTTYRQRLKDLIKRHEALITRKNTVDATWDGGVFERFVNPVVTAEHAPLTWRFDFDQKRNPHLLERLGVGAAFNPGAIEIDGKILLMVRVEGADRKSFFAVAESKNGIDNFRFWDEPVVLPETKDPATNVYDMRLVKHADGWIYGIFCAERKDPKAPKGDTSSATATAGIARSRDLVTWERLPDLKTRSQQRNVCLHPEFVNGKYMLYTRPQDGFIDTGSGGGIGWALIDSMEKAVVGDEAIMDPKIYHTMKEVKNGQGGAPLRTKDGWLHVAHGVRGCAAGLRYTTYAFLSDLKEPWKVTHRPSGHLIAPRGDERIGDVSNVIFTNGLVQRKDGTVLIYYASSDTRSHVARTTVDKLLDYVKNTPEDPYRTYECVQQRIELIRRNRKVLGGDDPRKLLKKLK
ncbi:MAG TPA: glycosidase [Planctomycetes bacterium]|nr:glycosidase [Planctomycetota bacterium]